jgi:hypothetical protein
MKKVLIGLFCLVLLVVGGGVYFVFTNLDAIVKRAIETAGSDAAGTPVRVESVELDLLGGSATIRGFTLANPEGFSDAPMLSFAELAVVIAPTQVNRQSISILSVTARNPHLLYEMRNGASNLDAVREQVASGAPASEQSGPDFNIDIGSIVIEDIATTVTSDLMEDPIEVDVGDVRLQNLSGTPDEIAQQVLRPLLTQLAINAGSIALTFLPEDVRAAGAAVRDAAGAAIDEAAGTLRNRVGNLFGGDEDEELEEESDEDAADAATAEEN